MPIDPSCGCTRRQVIQSLMGASLLMPGILSQVSHAGDAPAPTDPLAPHKPHFPAKAKRVIFLYMSGGASHVESFDHKPKLFADAGKSVASGKGNRFLLKPLWDFKPRGKSGIQISELFPNVAECADDLCVINSMKADHGNHFEATLSIHTGSATFARPSIGSWVSYGLGTFNQNLPSFVVLAPQLPYTGGQVWSSDFLPGCHQGVRVTPGPEPIANMNRKLPDAALQDMELNLLRAENRRHASLRLADPNLDARIKSYETAFGMQQEAPDAFDLSKETDETHALYGLKRGETKGFGWQCLVARRLAERGVRFIELIDSGASNNWDAHGDMKSHEKLAQNVDKPMAGLLKDLKRRGMLEDTLVVWTTEFGRTPFADNATAKGREHHKDAYSCWIAGGGVKPGFVYGETDEYGIQVAKNAVTTHDFHATLLHLLGMDHEKLTFRHGGRDFRLTDVAGNVVKSIIA